MKLNGLNLPKDLLKKFNINEKGIRLMDVEVATIDEYYPVRPNGSLVYPIPRTPPIFHPDFSDHESIFSQIYEMERADFIITLKLYINKEMLYKLRYYEQTGTYPNDLNIAGKPVKDCSISELLFAIQSKIDKENE